MIYSKNDRAQTNVDYIVSIGLFFTTLVIVISAASFLLLPDINSQENTVLSQSVAEKLTSDTLSENSEPQYVLSKECTVLFFSTMQTDTLPSNTPSWCQISETSVNKELLVDSERSIAIEITDLDNNIATLDSTDLQINSDSIPVQGEVQTTKKYIYIEQKQYILTVYIW